MRKAKDAATLPLFPIEDYASEIITGIILFFILSSEFFINYRVIVRGGKEAKGK